MMIKKYFVAISLIFTMLGSISLQAQKVEFYTYQLKHPIKLKAGKVFFKPLKNVGKETPMDVNGFVQQALDKFFEPVGGNSDKNPKVWAKSPWFVKTENAPEAAVILSGTYNILAVTKVEQYQFYETSSLISNPIPYFEVRPKNIVNAEVILNYQYADKTMDYDTIRYSDESERKAGRKMDGLAEMVASCSKSLNSDISSVFRWIDYEKASYQLEKVKISDKALKEEFKQAGELLKNHEVMLLGNLCKRIYENSPSNEAAFNLGICYELVGNYPQSTAYYKQMPDFHTIARMKKSLLFFDYIHELGVETELVEF
ncbi:MAG: hypothetical protein Q8O72_13310 [Bacteroidales bacterium]|nr:hypothetical protein [Bacteroidales bacterium]